MAEKKKVVSQHEGEDALPETIYVYNDRDPNHPSDVVLMASESPDEIGDDEVEVGVYKLVGKGRVKITHEFITEE